MQNLNLLRTFTKVTETGSFTKAATILNQPKSRVSRSIAKLERELGVELIRRTTRKTTLTNLGRDFYDRTHLLLRQLETEIDLISEAKDEIAGTIRITASEDIAQTLLVQLIANFQARYPKVQFQTIVTNEFLDLTAENIDIAFRAGKLKDTTLRQRKLTDVAFMLVASTKYLQAFGRPTAIADLYRHRMLFFRDIDVDHFLGKGRRNTGSGTGALVSRAPVFRSDSMPMLLNMVLEDGGIGILPDILCKPHLESGTLQQVIPDLDGLTSSVHVLYPPTASRNMAKRTRLFLDEVFV